MRKIILTAAIAMAVSGSAFAAGHGAKPLGIIIPPLASPQVHTNGIIIPPATATVKPAW